MNESLGKLDFTGKSLVEILKMSVERKTTIQKKLGLSPKDLIMTELFTNPTLFNLYNRKEEFYRNLINDNKLWIRKMDN